MERDFQMKRNFMHHEDFFMATAFLVAQRSKDPSTQVGACIVNENNVVVGMGHNMMPNDSDELPWNSDELDTTATKYPYVCHAATVAVLNTTVTDLKNCRIYVTLFPTCESAKVVIQSGIKEVVYLTDKYMNYDNTKAAKFMFNMTGVKYRQFEIKKDKKIVIDFEEFMSKNMPIQIK